MSQAYKVAQAFQATVSKEDKTPKTVTFDGNTFNAWKVKLDGHSDKGWINVNKKPGNEIAAGDELYGDINQVDGKFGTFYNFKSASRPLGEAPAQASTPAPADDFTANVSTEIVHDKLDYIIGLLEALTEKAGVDPSDVSVSTTAQGSPDLDDLDI
jgi:hypothetical protein